MEKQKKFGFISNFIYALNMEKKSNLMLLVITLIKPIADIVCTLLRSYTPKYVLSFMEQNLPVNKIITYTVNNLSYRLYIQYYWKHLLQWF